VGPPAPGATLPLELVGTLDAALAAASRAADARGLSARVLAPAAAGDVHAAASRFAHELVLNSADLLLWGGETTVQLPPTPGRGGRNQQFALAAARLIAGHSHLMLLAAGTDGSDGNTTMPVRSSMAVRWPASRGRASTPRSRSARRTPVPSSRSPATSCTPGRPARTSAT